MKFITSFRDKYYFLSNFYPCDITLTFENEKLTFSNAEAAFQSCKATDMNTKHMFTELNASEAKKLGRSVKLSPVWNTIRIDCMYAIVKQKFKQNPDLLHQLKQTSDAILVENNTWNDTFWGVCNNKGENHLGKILMRIRDEL